MSKKIMWLWTIFVEHSRIIIAQYIIMAKQMKTHSLHYPMTQFSVVSQRLGANLIFVWFQFESCPNNI